MSRHNDVCVSSNLPLGFISFKAFHVLLLLWIIRSSEAIMPKELWERKRKTHWRSSWRQLDGKHWEFCFKSQMEAHKFECRLIYCMFFFFLPSHHLRPSYTSRRLIFNSSSPETRVRCGQAEFNWLQCFCFIKPASRQLMVTDPTYVWFIYTGIWRETRHLQFIIRTLLESLWWVAPAQKSSVSFLFFYDDSAFCRLSWPCFFENSHSKIKFQMH